MRGDTPIAVDASGTPLPAQPNLPVSVNADGEPLIAVSDASGNPTGYLPPLYEVPSGFYVHIERDTDTGDVRAIAVDESGTPLPAQPTMHVIPDSATGDPRLTVLDAAGNPTGYQPPEYWSSSYGSRSEAEEAMESPDTAEPEDATDADESPDDGDTPEVEVIGDASVAGPTGLTEAELTEVMQANDATEVGTVYDEGPTIVKPPDPDEVDLDSKTALVDVSTAEMLEGEAEQVEPEVEVGIAEAVTLEEVDGVDLTVADQDGVQLIDEDAELVDEDVGLE